MIEDFDLDVPSDKSKELQIAINPNLDDEPFQDALEAFHQSIREALCSDDLIVTPINPDGVPMIPDPDYIRRKWLMTRHDFNPDGSGEWYLGTGDQSAIVAVNKHRSPLKIYAEMHDLVEREKSKPHMERGLILEPYVASLAQEKYGFEMRKIGFMRHPEHYHIGLNGDYEINHPEYGWIPCDIKTHRWFIKNNPEDGYGPDWSGIMPRYVAVQGNQQCHLMNLCYPDTPKRTHFMIMAMIGGVDADDVCPYVGEYNPKLSEVVVERTNAFIKDHLLAGVPPEPTGMECDVAIVKQMYPVSTEAVIEADEKCNEWCRLLMKQARTTSEAETEKKRLENLIKDYMKDCAVLLTTAGSNPTWRADKNGVRRFIGPK